MVKRIIFSFSLSVIVVWNVTGQELVVNGQRSSYEYKSYYYQEQLVLKPGFQVNGAQGEFFVRPLNESAVVLEKNLVRVETMLRSGVTDESQIAGLDEASKSLSYEYQDGLGRSVQTTLVKQSPGQQDAHQVYYYDAAGRASRAYLPYTWTSNGGLYNATGLSDQSVFYGDGHDAVADDSRPYWESVFENSPLGRAKESIGVGEQWLGKKVTSTMKVNDANTVRLWTISSNLPRSSSYYPAGSLSMKERVDEEGKTIREYIDILGNRILSQTLVGGGSWLNTYYVYNDYGKVVFVIPPVASGTLTPDQAFVNRWCFQYEYDDLQRAIGSKSPGSGWLYTIYDQWDRAVLTQNANQRSKSPAEWTFIKYDELNRPVMMGTYSSSSTRSALTTSVGSSSGRFESRNSSVVGYSLTQAFPTTATESMLMSITYYDDYTYLSNVGWDVEGNSYGFTQETGYTGTALSSVKGVQTGSKTRVLNSSQWLNGVTYYDNHYRALQVLVEHHLGGTVRQTTEYETFTGLVKSIVQVQGSPESIRIEQRYTYDHRGRLLMSYHRLNGQPEVLMSSLSYNELGQVLNKKLHSEDNGSTSLQSVDYRYTVKGWLSSVNYSSSASGDPVDYFGYKLGYSESLGSGNTPRYDGLVSGSKWKQDLSGSEKAYNYGYDVSGRLTQGSYRHNPTTGWINSGYYNETINGYDGNGNMTGLTRLTKNGGVSGVMDQLGYTYDGNQLTTVVDGGDASIKDKGFKDVVGSGVDYTYNSNGDLISDVNKGITEITYNVLNLPDKVTFTDGSYLQYLYDASGSRLRQSYYLSGASTPASQTDYVGDKVYANGSLVMILTDEGRLLPGSYTNLINNKDAGSTEGYTGVGANLSVVTQNGETYVRGICSQAGGSAGIYPIGGSISVKAGEKYSFKILGYRSTSGAAYLYVKGNTGVDIVWQGPLLAQGLANETWASTEFVIPSGVSSVTVGVRWATPATNETIYINRIALYKLDWEYQYLITDQLGSPRVVLSTNPSTLKYTATFETGNQNLEASQFFNINTSKTVPHTSNVTPGGSKVIAMDKTYRIGPSRSLRVYPGDEVDASVSAYYGTASGLSDASAATLAAALIQVMTDGGVTGFDGGISTAYNNSESSVSGFALSPSNGSTRPSAFLNYILFDENYVALKAKSFPVGSTAGQSTLISISASLGSPIRVEKPGYVFVYLSYDNENTVPVYFDQFKIEHKESPMVQVNDYYPFGLTSYSWVREGEYENRYLYQGKEKDDKTGWHDFHARQYDAALARWLMVDPMGQFASPYLAMGNNPVMGVDPDGKIVWFVPVIIGAVIGGTIGGIVAHNNGQEWWKGAITGAIIGAAAGAGASAAIGASGMTTTVTATTALGEVTQATVYTTGWTLASSAAYGGALNAGFSLVGGGEAWKAALSGAVTSLAGSGLSYLGTKLLSSGSTLGSGFAKLGYQVFSTTASSVAGNIASGRNAFYSVNVGVGPFTLPFRHGKFSTNLLDHIGNIAFVAGNYTGLKGVLTRQAKIVFDKSTLSWYYRDLTGQELCQLMLDGVYTEDEMAGPKFRPVGKALGRWRAAGGNLYGQTYLPSKPDSGIMLHESIHMMIRRYSADTYLEPLFRFFNYDNFDSYLTFTLSNHPDGL